MKNLLLASVLLTLAHPVYALDFTLETIKLSPRVVVFRGYDKDFPVGGKFITTALATEKGIVLIDPTGIPTLINRIKNDIESIFQRSDYAYIINTGANVNFLGGNVHFPNVEIIGQSDIVGYKPTIAGSIVYLYCTIVNINIALLPDIPFIPEIIVMQRFISVITIHTRTAKQRTVFIVDTIIII